MKSHVAGPAVTVRVPGSTSNLGSGFDCVGVAVDRWLTVTARPREEGGPALEIRRRGMLAALEEPPEGDLIYLGFAAACGAIARDTARDLIFEADSAIPLGRGFGSSAAAVVAGAALANHLLGLGLDDGTLAAVCAGVEGHPDNVAAAVFGGAVLALHDRSGRLRVAPLEVHETLAFAFAVPGFAVATRKAREALPATVTHATAAAAAARGAALARGLATGERTLLELALDDVLHVPYRHALVPGFEAVAAAAVRAGAFGATLSGSGSSMVAIAPRELAAAVGEAMRAAWNGLGVGAECFESAGRVGGLEIVPA
jgi:homoserine kinase